MIDENGLPKSFSDHERLYGKPKKPPPKGPPPKTLSDNDSGPYYIGTAIAIIGTYIAGIITGLIIACS